mmetsp:Transcript_24075/g.71350  ORF Transcript_24075/g.71350 Transcript_24075/m.71350 type:complete len:275 (-) Transcript_24075:52-876(-)
MRPARSLWAFPALRPPSSPPRAWCLATSANASSISRRRCANSSSVSAALDAICSRRAASPSVRSSGGEITAPPVNSQTLKAGWSAEFSTSRSLLPERPLREERTATAARSSDSRDCADAANTFCWWSSAALQSHRSDRASSLQSLPPSPRMCAQSSRTARSCAAVSRAHSPRVASASDNSSATSTGSVSSCPDSMRQRSRSRSALVRSQSCWQLCKRCLVLRELCSLARLFTCCARAWPCSLDASSLARIAAAVVPRAACGRRAADGFARRPLA